MISAAKTVVQTQPAYKLHVLANLSFEISIATSFQKHGRSERQRDKAEF